MKQLTPRWIALVTITAITLYVTWLIFQPFINVVLWSIVLTVIASPLYEFISRYQRSANISAALTLAIVLILGIIPITFVVYAVVSRLEEGVATVHSVAAWLLDPGSAHAKWLAQYVDVEMIFRRENVQEIVKRVGSYIAQVSPDVVGYTVVTVMQFLLVLFTTSYGVFPLIGWAASQTFSRLGSVGRMLTRALPLLLLFTTFLFINAEVWQVAGTLEGPVYIVTLALFFVLGSAFVLSRTPEAIRTIHTFDEWAEVARLVEGTPAAGLALPADGDPDEMPLSRRQRVNIGLVTVFSQAILISFVAVVLAVFFMLFGFLAIPQGTTAFWTQLTDVHVLARWHVGGRTLVLTEPLLRVAGFLGAFTGMYFTVVLGTDATYRGEFAEDAGPQIRQALAVRLAYRHTSLSE